MRKPSLCGRNRVNLPESGCDECAQLEYRIEQLEDRVDAIEEWIMSPLTEEQIEALTPLECYVPECADSRVCYGEACCAIVACE